MDSPALVSCFMCARPALKIYQCPGCRVTYAGCVQHQEIARRQRDLHDQMAHGAFSLRVYTQEV